MRVQSVSSGRRQLGSKPASSMRAKQPDVNCTVIWGEGGRVGVGVAVRVGVEVAVRVGVAVRVEVAVLVGVADGVGVDGQVNDTIPEVKSP